jgi:hypothetical protein
MGISILIGVYSSLSVDLAKLSENFVQLCLYDWLLKAGYTAQEFGVFPHAVLTVANPIAITVDTNPLVFLVCA